jgi:hypothetical protein
LPIEKEANISIDLGSPPHLLGDGGTPNAQGDREHSQSSARLRALPSSSEVWGIPKLSGDREHFPSPERLGVFPTSASRDRECSLPPPLEIGSTPYLAGDGECSLSRNT